MTIRVILASVVSAVVLFAWGFVYWSVLAMMFSPWHAISPEGEPDVIATVKQAFPESGVYMYPWVDSSSGDQQGSDEQGTEEDFQQQHAEGPIVQVFYHAAGIPAAEMGKTMGFGFVHMLVCAVISCFLLASAKPLCCYSARVCFVFGLGLFATLWIEGANVIWWHHPTSHALFLGAYNVIAWLLAGLVIGAIVKKPNPGAAVESTSP